MLRSIRMSYFLCKLMAIGEAGLHGRHVQSHVDPEQRVEAVAVIIRPLNMVEVLVPEVLLRQQAVTRIAVQVKQSC